MIQSVRKAAYFGDPPEMFYTNASESINNVLKLKVDRRSQSLMKFVDHAQELVSVYEKNIERAFEQRGEWRLLNRDVYANESNIKNALRQVKESLCTLSSFLGGTENLTVEFCSDTAELEPCTSDLDEKKELTMPYNVLLESGCKIHIDTLKGIWQKASSLVPDTSLVAAVPGSSSSTYNHMVASSSSGCPHLVTTPVKNLLVSLNVIQNVPWTPHTRFVHILLPQQRLLES